MIPLKITRKKKWSNSRSHWVSCRVNGRGLKYHTPLSKGNEDAERTVKNSLLAMKVSGLTKLEDINELVVNGNPTKMICQGVKDGLVEWDVVPEWDSLPWED